MIHAGNPASSLRLRRVLDVLRAAGSRGVTSLELQERASTVAPGTCVSELRASGLVVECAYEGRADGRKVYRYTLRESGQLTLSLAPA